MRLNPTCVRIPSVNLLAFFFRLVFSHNKEHDYYLFLSSESCQSTGPLGMTDLSIPDQNIIASSHQLKGPPEYARLGLQLLYWITVAEDLEPWIQVDMGNIRLVTGLLTEGNDEGGDFKYWVQELKVQVGMSVEGLVFIGDTNGHTKVC